MTKDDPSGLVFDIQRAALHDGPGIRTTVFLQGCPLRCPWCHNPEGQKQGPVISYRQEACNLCCCCELACKHGAHTFEYGLHRYDRSVCDGCGSCVEACVFGALRSVGRQWRVSEVMSLVLRDQVYYRFSGGGLTLSGGEPLFQARFARALLTSAKESLIHTCIETCGEATRAAFGRILPLVDLFLFDCKITDLQRHKAITGVDNRRILSNLDFLYGQGAKIRLRCPLIPGVNDTSEHLEGIAALAARYPRLLGVEIMPYHGLGHAKYVRFGLPDPMLEAPTMDRRAQGQMLDSLQRLGCRTASLD